MYIWTTFSATVAPKRVSMPHTTHGTACVKSVLTNERERGRHAAVSVDVPRNAAQCHLLSTDSVMSHSMHQQHLIIHANQPNLADRRLEKLHATCGSLSASSPETVVDHGTAVVTHNTLHDAQ